MTSTEAEISPSPSLRFRVGQAVLQDGEAYAIVELTSDGYILEALRPPHAQHFAEGDTVTPAP